MKAQWIKPIFVQTEIIHDVIGEFWRIIWSKAILGCEDELERITVKNEKGINKISHFMTNMIILYNDSCYWNQWKIISILTHGTTFVRNNRGFTIESFVKDNFTKWKICKCIYNYFIRTISETKEKTNEKSLSSLLK